MKVKLKFGSLLNMWNFLEATGARQFTIDIEERSLTGRCNDEQLELATKKFGATIVWKYRRSDRAILSPLLLLLETPVEAFQAMLC